MLNNKYLSSFIMGVMVVTTLYSGTAQAISLPKLGRGKAQPSKMKNQVIKLGDISAQAIKNGLKGLSTKQKKEVDIMARTIYGEARGEKSDQALVAIAHVILNRANDKENKWAKCPIKVSTQRRQFSCWNRNDPNYRLITKVTLKNKNFRRAYKAALIALANTDVTNGANHYHSVFMRRKPKWTRNKKMIALAQIGNHKFYRA